MKVEVSPTSIKSALNTIKIVKPIFGDYSLTIKRDRFIFSSYDKRRSVVAVVNIDDQGKDLDEEFFISIDRASIFESDLGSLSFSINDKGLNIKHHGNGITKTALLKRRAVGSKRPSSPGIPSVTSTHSITQSDMESMLKSASCSALVKESHTEEDMKVNQIHFYSKHKSIYSNARYYASCIYNDHISFDASIVSADIPIIRFFSTRCDEQVQVNNEGDKLVLLDPKNQVYLSISGISIKKPDFVDLKVGESKHDLIISSDSWKQSIKWAVLTLEGTQRISMSVVTNEGSSELKLLNGDMTLSSYPVINRASDFASDFPLKVLLSISEYLSDGELRILFGVSGMPDVMVLEQNINGTKAHHFIRSMKSK